MKGKWVPFRASDVQMEFVRIDPFVRLTLNSTKSKTSSHFNRADLRGTSVS